MFDEKDRKQKPEIQNPCAWSVDDVARELKVSVRHVYRLVSEGKIPYAKVGRLVRFSPEQVIAWLARGGSR